MGCPLREGGDKNKVEVERSKIEKWRIESLGGGMEPVVLG
jgi:hypothetical protein